MSEENEGQENSQNTDTNSQETDTNAELVAMREQMAVQAKELEQSRRSIAETNAERIKQDAETKAAHEQTLIEGKKYKQLYETRNNELKSLQDAQRETAMSVDRTFKSQAKQTAALKAGIREDALGMLDMMPDDELELRKTESGVLDVTGAEKWVENLKTSSPFLFKSSTAPNMTGGRPSSSTPSTSKKVNLLELERTDPAHYKIEMEALIKTNGIQIK